MQFYVYQHNKKDNGEIFYVGKGKDKRYLQTKGRNAHWTNVVNKYGFESEIIVKDIDEEFAFLVEMEAIDLYRRRGIKLVNKTNGGEGTSGFSRPHSEEHKQSMKGNTYGSSVWGINFKGKSHSEEQKQKWSQTRKGMTSPRKGVNLSDETKEKLRLARIDKPLSESHKAAISKGLIGNRHTAKLSDDEVRFIRANQGKMTHIELGQKFNVHKNTIHKIWRLERYKGVI